MGRSVSGSAVIAAPTTTTDTTNTETTDPRKEGLPMFAVWSMYDDQFRYVQCSTYGPDGSQTNNPWAYATYSSPNGSYAGGVFQDKYLGYSGDNQGFYRTSSTVSSNSTNYLVGRTQDNTHWPSSASINIGPTGQFASNIGFNNASRSYFYLFRFMTTQVLPEGVRPRMFLGSNNQEIWRSAKPATAQYGIHTEKFQLNDADIVAAFPELANKRYTTQYGMSGYNEKTGYYVLFTKTSNQNVDMFKWKLQDRITDPKVNFKEAFLNATEFEYRQMDNSNNMSGDDGYYRGIITVGDNGYCRWTRWQQGSSITTNLFHLDPNVASNFITANSPDSTGETYGAAGNSYQWSDNNTTSYGIDQGTEHQGIQYNSTWDNKWHLHFGHYYYYGAGINAYICSTEDPRVCYRFENKDTTYGSPPVANGRTGFIFGMDNNSDSSDVYYRYLNMHDVARTWEDLTASGRGTVWTYTLTTLTSNYQQIPNTSRSGLVPAHGYYSTNYPRILNVNWWPTKDGIMQFPGDY